MCLECFNPGYFPKGYHLPIKQDCWARFFDCAKKNGQGTGDSSRYMKIPTPAYMSEKNTQVRISAHKPSHSGAYIGTHRPPKESRLVRFDSTQNCQGSGSGSKILGLQSNFRIFGIKPGRFNLNLRFHQQCKHRKSHDMHNLCTSCL